MGYEKSRAIGLLRVGQSEEKPSLRKDVQRAVESIPKQTFYRLPSPDRSLLGSEKILLTRKANELFHLGQIARAEKIYLTVGYSAGLHKLGEYYFQKNDFLRAYLFFRAADDSQRAEALTERFIVVIRKWLKNPVK